MSEQPVSPTGAPLLPPKVAQILGIVVVAALAGLGSAVAFYPDSKALQIALAVVTALAAVLGIASPGLRRMSVVLLAAAPLALGSCAHWNPTPGQDAKLINCASQSILTAVVELVPDVIAAISGQNVDWGAALSDLLKAEGPKALCAGQVVADILTGTPSDGAKAAKAAGVGGLGGSEVSPVLQARVEAWLALHRAEFAADGK